MLPFKYLLKKTSFRVNPYYDEAHSINNVNIEFVILPEIEYSTDFNRNILVLNIKASFIDADDLIEIIAYEGYAKAVLEVTNRKDDIKELKIWLAHILATLKGYWTNVCPIPYMSNKLTLDKQKESDKILDFLEAKGLYI